MMTNLTTGLTADALAHYRQLVLVRKETHLSAILATSRLFGVPATIAATDLYKANPALQRLADDE